MDFIRIVNIFAAPQKAEARYYRPVTGGMVKGSQTLLFDICGLAEG